MHARMHARTHKVTILKYLKCYAILYADNSLTICTIYNMSGRVNCIGYTNSYPIQVIQHRRECCNL